MSPPKNCTVCGDKALGYNFNAVTCESCKAFFRRNALAKKQFTCPFNQNCEITVVTRRFCQKCRLKKCLDIGMKSENIMSEEDKMAKKRKIENNRAKRRMLEQKNGNDATAESECGDVKTENEGQRALADSSCNLEMYTNSYDSQSCGSSDSMAGTNVRGAPASNSSKLLNEHLADINSELMTSEEMVDFIVCDPDRASQAISKLMRTPKEAISVMEKIINTQKDALRLVSHLIDYPGDGLKIISKIMNSPFNALTVFTKFMSSPTDGLEIISKIVSSPQDVVLFIKNLMQSPEDGLDIMNKFMNTPAEALKMLNRIFNGSTNSTAAESTTTATAEAATTNVYNTFCDTSNCTNVHTMHTPQKTQDILERVDSVIQTMTSAITGTTSSTSSVDASTPSVLAPIMTNNLHSPPIAEFITTPMASPTSYTSPISAIDLQYSSPNTNQTADELPSTSNTQSLPYITPPDFDLKSYMSTATHKDEYLLGVDMHLNSLESVLSEVIRIEYQGFNSLQAASRIKEEQQMGHGNTYPLNNLYGSCNATIHQQQQQQSICTPSSIYMERDLNEAEQIKLRELRIASEALYDPVEEDLSVLMMGDDRIKPDDARHNPKLLQLINLTAVAIKRLIKMAKKITAFRDMCQEDQVALLKGGCTEMMIMRAVMIYDDDRNTWQVPHTKENMRNIRADLLKLAAGNVYEEHIRFISTFDEKWRMDENIILIMCAIVLFTPSRHRIIHKDVIRLEQNSYYYLLRRYLESVYPGCEAKNAFIKLIQKISDVERLNKVIINVYLNVNPTQVEPLLREIFDLKNH